MICKILIFVLLLVQPYKSKQSPTNQQIVRSLIKKLYKVCQIQNDGQIPLIQCQQKMIENDKKTGNYRQDYNYTRQSIYMMHTYDIDKNRKLNYKQLYRMAMDIMGEKISDAKIQLTVAEIQGAQTLISQGNKKQDIKQQL